MVDALAVVVEDAVMVDVMDSGTSNIFTSSMLATSPGFARDTSGFARDTSYRIFVMVLVGVMVLMGVKSKVVS